MKNIFNQFGPSMLAIVASAVVIVLGVSSISEAKPGVHGCQDIEAMRVCLNDDGGAATVIYKGYLIASGQKVHIQGNVNGRDFDHELITFGVGQDMFQLVSIPRSGPVHLTVYAVDDSGRFDSRFGNDYIFDLN